MNLARARRPIVRREPLADLRDRCASLAADLVGIPAGRISLAGDLAHLGAAELLSMLHQLRKTGLLVISAGEESRAFLIVEGGLAWASSSRPGERTGGERVHRLDLAAIPRQPPTAQIKSVLAGLLRESAGTFALVVLEPPPQAATLDTQRLLLECLCSLDERSSTNAA